MRRALRVPVGLSTCFTAPVIYSTRFGDILPSSRIRILDVRCQLSLLHASLRHFSLQQASATCAFSFRVGISLLQCLWGFAGACRALYVLRNASKPFNVLPRLSPFLSGSDCRLAVPVVPSTCFVAPFLPSAGFHDLRLFLSGWDFRFAVCAELCWFL